MKILVLMRPNIILGKKKIKTIIISVCSILGGAKCMQKKIKEGRTMAVDIKTKKMWKLSLHTYKWQWWKWYSEGRFWTPRWWNLYHFLALWIHAGHSPFSLIFLSNTMQKHWKHITFIEPWFCASGIYNSQNNTGLCTSLFLPFLG